MISIYKFAPGIVGKRRELGAVALAGLIPMKLGAEVATASSTNIFSSVSTPAIVIKQLAMLVFGVTAAIFLVVATLLVFVIVRYRARGEDGTEPPQVYGSERVELAWTVIPVLIVIVLFWPRLG